ncbi:uncharacterized protein METZ01_LOCUS245368, partial [marine metagenome]
VIKYLIVVLSLISFKKLVNFIGDLTNSCNGKLK